VETHFIKQHEKKALLLLLKELLLGKADLCSDATVLESGGISYPLHPFLI
jgi:hypothetical protein